MCVSLHWHFRHVTRWWFRYCDRDVCTCTWGRRRGGAEEWERETFPVWIVNAVSLWHVKAKDWSFISKPFESWCFRNQTIHGKVQLNSCGLRYCVYFNVVCLNGQIDSWVTWKGSTTPWDFMNLVVLVVLVIWFNISEVLMLKKGKYITKCPKSAKAQIFSVYLDLHDFQLKGFQPVFWCGLFFQVQIGLLRGPNMA